MNNKMIASYMMSIVLGIVGGTSYYYRDNILAVILGIPVAYLIGVVQIVLLTLANREMNSE